MTTLNIEKNNTLHSNEVNYEDKPEKFLSTVISKQILNDSIIRLRLTSPFEYTAGQYLSVENPLGESRCYSMVSHPTIDNFIELHIQHYPTGRLSNWIYSDLKAGDKVTLHSPVGDCVYQSDDKYQTLYLAATGMGAGVMMGVARDAISKGHKGKIKLLLGGLNANSFFLYSELNELREQGVDIHQVSLDENINSQKFIFQANVYDYATKLFSHLADAKVYLCGAPNFVQKMRTQCFEAGASMRHVHSDAFFEPT